MKITLDTEKKYVIIPDNFFDQIEKINEFRRENGVDEVKPMAYIRDAFEKAMSNTDRNLKRKSDVTAKRQSKSAPTQESK